LLVARLKALWFQAFNLRYYHLVKAWFKKVFAFESNLYPYALGRLDLSNRPAAVEAMNPVQVALYTLNAVDPQLESAWFQPLNPSSEKPIPIFSF
jgi:hypothetical protein